MSSVFDHEHWLGACRSSQRRPRAEIYSAINYECAITVSAAARPHKAASKKSHARF